MRVHGAGRPYLADFCLVSQLLTPSFGWGPFSMGLFCIHVLRNLKATIQTVGELNNLY